MRSLGVRLQTALRQKSRVGFLEALSVDLIFIPLEVGGSVRTPRSAQRNDVKLFTVSLASFSYSFSVYKNEGSNNPSQPCQLMSSKRNKKTLLVLYSRKTCVLVTPIFLVWC